MELLFIFNFQVFQLPLPNDGKTSVTILPRMYAAVRNAPLAPVLRQEFAGAESGKLLAGSVRASICFTHGRNKYAGNARKKVNTKYPA